MGETMTNWKPTWTVNPGETLLEVLEERGLRQADLVRATGFTAKHVNQVIKGRAHIGVEFALALEVALGIDAQFWMNLQTQHDIALARGVAGGEVSDGD